jgi:5-methylcytosine-specific restriction endonuclease McrA
MTIAVYQVWAVVEGLLLEKPPVPKRSAFRHGNLVGLLTSMPDRGDETAPTWTIEIRLSEGSKAQRVTMPLCRFLTREEYSDSHRQPWSLVALEDAVAEKAKEADSPLKDLSWAWLFRDTFYVTERLPQPSELSEVVLRIKAAHFQESDSLRRLAEQVANLEAVERNITKPPSRDRIPEDVKLVVWTRDGGVCVKCGAARELQFDHVIPFARGGSNEPTNLQILCKPCNLAKRDRIA